MPLLLMFWRGLKKVPMEVWAAIAVLLIIWWMVDGYGDRRFEAGQAEVQSRWDKQKELDLQAQRKAVQDARKAEERYRAEVRAVAQRFLDKQEEAREENERLVAAVAAGERRLRQRFTCPAGVPGTGPTTGGADAAPEGGLSPEDFRVLAGIAADGDRAIRQLTALQEACAIRIGGSK